MQDHKEPFTVQDDRSAQWALRKLGEIRAEIKRAEDVAESEITRVTDWLSGEVTRLQEKEAYFRNVLEPWVLAQREEGRKTVSLPAGMIKTRQVNGRPRVEDATVLLDWCRDHAPELVRVKESVDGKGLSEVARGAGGVVVTSDGEVVPGVVWEPSKISVQFETGQS